MAGSHEVDLLGRDQRDPAPRPNGRWSAVTRRLAAVATCISVLIPWWLLGTPAQADPLIVQTTPSNHETVYFAVNKVQLIFDESIAGSNVEIAVVGPGGNRVEVGRPKVSGISVVQRIRVVDISGDVTVGYRVELANGRNVTGGFSWAVGLKGQMGPVTESPSVIASALAQIGTDAQAAPADPGTPAVRPWWRSSVVVAVGAVVLVVAAGWVVLAPGRGRRVATDRAGDPERVRTRVQRSDRDPDRRSRGGDLDERNLP